MPTRIAGCRGELLWELEITTKQSVAMAESIPPGKYDWRPHPAARSFAEVFVHVATGNFMLLDVIGVPAPADLYPQIPADGQARLLGFIKRNDELVASVRDKDRVVALIKRSLQAVNDSLTQTTESEFGRALHFFGEDTTVRRVYLRLITHAHEHMGQLIAYLRFNDIAPPWQDWRPDRRIQS